MTCFWKLDGIDGESKDKQSQGQDRHLFLQPRTVKRRRRALRRRFGAGKAQITDISIGKLVDKSSATLYKFCYQGKHIATGKVLIRKAAGETPLEYLKYELNEVFITSVNTSDSAGGGIANEFISLNFSKIKMTYDMQADTGGELAKPEVTIDVKENTVS